MLCDHHRCPAFVDKGIHNHACLFYENDLERQQLLESFLVAGLDMNDKVIYYGNPADIELVRGGLAGRGIDLERKIGSRQLILRGWHECHLYANKHFTAESCLQNVQRSLEEALADGYSAVRVAGEAIPASNEFGYNEFLDLEAAINTVLDSKLCPVPLIGLCLYNLRTCDASFLLDALDLHPKLMSATSWMDNIYFDHERARFQEPSAHSVRRRLQNASQWSSHVLALSARCEELEQENQRLMQMNASLLEELQQLKMIEQELRSSKDEGLRVKEEAEKEAQCKAEFLAMVSHELKTPLNSVLMSAHALSSSSLASSGDSRELLSTIQVCSSHLLGLITDVMDWSKIEARKLVLELEQFDLHGCIDDAILICRHRIGSKPLLLLCNIDHTVPRLVTGDAMRVRQVLVNIVGNAVKFTAHGQVVLNVSTLREDDELVRTTVVFQATDTGPGIPANSVSKIFDQFVQIGKHRAGGVGLGLPISRHLLSLMSGSIQVRSSEGVGSTFTFRIPFSTSDSATPSPPCQPLVPSGAPAPLPLPESHSHCASESPSESACLSPARAVSDAFSSEPPECPALSSAFVSPFHRDLQRAAPPDDSQSPPAASASLSGGPSWVLKRQRSPSMEDYGPNSSSCSAARRRLSSSSRAPSPAAALPSATLSSPTSASGSPSPDKPAGPRQRILLAEDNAMNQKLQRRLLESLGYAVDVANNGAEAVQAVQDSPEPYDLILMDLLMPEMDGLEATRRIRSMPAAAAAPCRVPIVALTASSLEDVRQQCLDAGMVGFINKPFNASRMLHTLHSFLSPQPSVAPSSHPPFS